MKKVKLGEVCDVFSGYAFKSFNEVRKGKPVIKIGNVLSNGKIEIEDCYYTEEIPQNKYLSQKNDIYVALSGATTGKVGLMQKEGFLINQRVGVVRLKNNGVPINYIYSFLQSKTSKILEDAFGAAQPNISPKDILNYEIFIGENAEMQAIADRLDKVSSLIEKHKTQLSKLDQLIKSRFIEMFENKGYPQITIGELVASKVSSVKKVFLPTDVIKYIDISSIDNKRNVMTGYTEYILGEAPSRAQQYIKKGDIVVSTVRPNLKNVAITNFESNNLVASSGFCVLRAEKCLPSYLMAVVCSDDFTDAMTKVVTGANYPAIKDSDVRNYVVPNPPIELQEQFSAFVEQTDKSKLAIQKSIDKLETLKKSLMQQYFG